MAVFSLIELGEYMTESEAIEIVRKEKAYMDSHAGRAQSEAYQIAINALEKQIPKKPIIETYRYTTLFICPYCERKQGIKYKQYHCIECGQKLDWSDEE